MRENIITNFLKKKKLITLINLMGTGRIFFCKLFKFNNFKKIFKNKFSQSDYYILHFRSGDFKLSRAHNILNIDYYKKAIQYFSDKKLIY